MIMTSVGGRAHRGPVTRSARAGLGGPRTRIGAIRKAGVCWEGRNAVEDGEAVARTNQPEQDHHSGRGPRLGVGWSSLFYWLSDCSAAAARDMRKGRPARTGLFVGSEKGGAMPRPNA